MKLYYHPLSGHAHRARLFLSLIGVAARARRVDLAAGAHKPPEFLQHEPLRPGAGAGRRRHRRSPIPTRSWSISPRSIGKDDWLPETPAARRRRCSAGCRSPPARSPSARRPRASSPCSARSSTPRKSSRRAHAVLKLIDDELAGRELDRRGHADHRRRRALQLHRPRAGGQCRSLRLSQRAAPGCAASRRCRASSRSRRRPSASRRTADGGGRTAPAQSHLRGARHVHPLHDRRPFSLARRRARDAAQRRRRRADGRRSGAASCAII